MIRLRASIIKIAMWFFLLMVCLDCLLIPAFVFVEWAFFKFNITDILYCLPSSFDWLFYPRVQIGFLVILVPFFAYMKLVKYIDISKDGISYNEAGFRRTKPSWKQVTRVEKVNSRFSQILLIHGLQLNDEVSQWMMLGMYDVLRFPFLSWYSLKDFKQAILQFAPEGNPLREYVEKNL